MDNKLGKALPESPRSPVSHIGFTVLDADAEIHKMLVKLRADLEAVVQAIQALELMEQQRRSKDARTTEPATPTRKPRKGKNVISIEIKR